MLSPIWPFIAIPPGWITADVGRQPWVVYPSTTGPDGVALLTADGVSVSVSNWELLLTIGLFIVVYLILLIGWCRVVGRFIKEGPVSPKAKGQVPMVATVAAGAGNGDVTAADEAPASESFAAAEVKAVAEVFDGKDPLPPFAAAEEAKDASAADASTDQEGRE